jgi:tRNA threonylcarbamoyladenosine biosynthesis protein TsaB
MVRLLAFDTSTETMVAAALGPRGRSGAAAPGGPAASSALLPLLESQLEAAGLAYADLDAIAFGRGPGAFTGLRTSCAVAQGLGLGLGRPLLALDSLLLVAEDARAACGLGAGEVVAVAMDARMDEVYAARYAWQPPRWVVLDAPALYTLAALQAAWGTQPATLRAGNATAAFGARLACPPGARDAGPERDRAAALLRLAEAGWTAGDAVDPAQALPLYLRDKVALTTDERAAARAATAMGAVDAPGASAPTGAATPP